MHQALVAQMVKHVSTLRETWLQFLGQEDPLEKEMATHSSTLPEVLMYFREVRKIPWMEEPGRLQSTGSLRVGHD